MSDAAAHDTFEREFNSLLEQLREYVRDKFEIESHCVSKGVIPERVIDLGDLVVICLWLEKSPKILRS